MAANLVIRSPETVVMLSILQVEGACERRARRAAGLDLSDASCAL